MATGSMVLCGAEEPNMNRELPWTSGLASFGCFCFETSLVAVEPSALSSPSATLEGFKTDVDVVRCDDESNLGGTER